MTYPAFVEIPENEHFASMFGAVEMEETAMVIYKMLAPHQKWDEDLAFFDFPKDEDIQVGLFMLAVGGWIADCETSGSFVMMPEFAERIVSHLPVPAEKRILFQTGAYKA